MQLQFHSLPPVLHAFSFGCGYRKFQITRSFYGYLLSSLSFGGKEDVGCDDRCDGMGRFNFCAVPNRLDFTNFVAVPFSQLSPAAAGMICERTLSTSSKH